MGAMGAIALMVSVNAQHLHPQFYRKVDISNLKRQGLKFPIPPLLMTFLLSFSSL